MDKKVSDFIDNLKSPQKEILGEFRSYLKKLLPQAEEYFGYGVPAFRQTNKSVYYSVFKNHLGFYPGAELIENFKDDLKDYKTSKGTIKFRFDQKIPYDLVKKIINKKFLLSH